MSKLIEAVKQSIPSCFPLRIIESDSVLLFIIGHPLLCVALTELLDATRGLLLRADEQEALLLVGNTEIHLLAGVTPR